MAAQSATAQQIMLIAIGSLCRQYEKGRITGDEALRGIRAYFTDDDRKDDEA